MAKMTAIVNTKRRRMAVSLSLLSPSTMTSVPAGSSAKPDRRGFLNAVNVRAGDDALALGLAFAVSSAIYTGPGEAFGVLGCAADSAPLQLLGPCVTRSRSPPEQMLHPRPTPRPGAFASSKSTEE